ncbi:MAG: hypothetical protein K0R47_4431 [Brevibacillus sp.]|nr:hypothetical protein [Brevibacillus sp.]
MSEAMLLELRFALNYNMDSAALFPLILVGQPELRKLLRLKKYEATVQRIGMQYHLSGMSKEETSAYIRHHMTVSRTEKPVFAESALARIFAASQGLPRVVNQICMQILFDAAARNLEVIEEADVVRVLADMDRQRPARCTVRLPHFEYVGNGIMFLSLDITFYFSHQALIGISLEAITTVSPIFGVAMMTFCSDAAFVTRSMGSVHK